MPGDSHATTLQSEPPNIDAVLVRRLIAGQFPQWAGLLVRPVIFSGWDNRTFHLGEDLVVRLPNGAQYANQVTKEHRWLPELAPHLPLKIPEPIAIGTPAYGYQHLWSVYRWIDGEVAGLKNILDQRAFAACLANFLLALQSIDATGGPSPGLHNFFRGGSLAVYDGQAKQALDILRGKIDTKAAIRLWDAALASSWSRAPVWVHGDISVGNLLVQNGRLHAVIDFGQLTTGDPACDLTMTWTVFKDESRKIFQKTLDLDTDTWTRARAWAFWKAAIVASGLAETNAVDWSEPWRVIDEVLAVY